MKRRGFGAMLLSLVLAGLMVLAPLANASSPAAVDALSDNLTAYWKLDEASGTRFDALSGCGGSGCDLTDNNTVASAAGKLGNAALFDAANAEFLSHADHADLDACNCDFTLAAWANITDKSTTRAIIGKYQTTGNQREYVLLYDVALDRFRFAVSSDGAGAGSLVGVNADTAGAPALSTWYFIVAWHDAGADTLNIQVNNGSVDSVAHAAGVYAGTSLFTVGAYLNGTGARWNGLIDEVGFWKRSLTTDERTWLYNAGAGCTHSFAACEPTPTPTPSDTPTATDTPEPGATETDTPVPPPATDTPEPGATATDTPVPSNTPPATSTPAATTTPAYLTVVTLDSGDELWLERRWSVGERAIFAAIIMHTALYGLHWLYELADKRSGGADVSAIR